MLDVFAAIFEALTKFPIGLVEAHRNGRIAKYEVRTAAKRVS